MMAFWKLGVVAFALFFLLPWYIAETEVMREHYVECCQEREANKLLVDDPICQSPSKRALHRKNVKCARAKAQLNQWSSTCAMSRWWDGFTMATRIKEAATSWTVTFGVFGLLALWVWRRTTFASEERRHQQTLMVMARAFGSHGPNSYPSHERVTYPSYQTAQQRRVQELYYE
jgi:hypothetical protein